MGHDETADHTGGNAPAGLMGEVELVVAAGEGDLKGLGKAVAEVVAGTGLQSLTVVHHALHGVGSLPSPEKILLLLSLHTINIKIIAKLPGSV